MLFDAIINLFKTICIGLIAFSPLLVYKLTDDSSSSPILNSNPSDNEIVYNRVESNNNREQQDSTQTSMPSFSFSGSSSFFGSTAPPPPPPAPVDAPIDGGLWLLLLAGIGYFAFKQGVFRKYFKHSPKH